jgi:ABC-type phosphate/phosphonate transport system substrate-binding protein
LITSFRMYNAVPAAAAAWRALFGRVFAESGVDVDVIEHGWPKPIDELWRDPQLCCGFMCGWPFTKSELAMQAIAAPVPSPARYEHLPRYCSEFLVRESSGFATLRDTFGHRFGWMAVDSQSGFNAPRNALSRYIDPARPSLYRESIGPLGTPARALQSLRDGEVDVIALDSFFLDLCRRHDPARLGGIRTIDTTRWTPIPMLVAAPGIEAATVARLRDHLLRVHERAECRELLDKALVERFVIPDLAGYAVLEEMATEAIARGYPEIR